MPGRETFGVARQGSHTDLQLLNYAEVPSEVRFAGATVVNCVGTDRGSPKKLDAVNHCVPLAWASAARAGGARHFIQLSSFSVYALTPLVGAASAVAPASAYGRSKLVAENGLRALAAPGFAVSLLRVPILLGGAADKLAALMKIIRRTHVIPRPAVPMRRAMLTYGGLGAAVGKLIEHPISGVIAAADPEPFSYDLVAECASAVSMRTIRLPVPKVAAALMRAAAPSIGNRLFGSMELAPESNLLTDSAGYATVRDLIRAHLSR